MSNITSPATSTAQMEANERGLNGDTGDQILKNGSANNATTVIHTVTALKNFYLTALHAWIYASTSSGGTPSVIITNAADAVVWTIFSGQFAVNTTGVGIPFHFIRPIKIPAGYKIKIISNSTTITISASVSGWEEPA